MLFMDYYKSGCFFYCSFFIGVRGRSIEFAKGSRIKMFLRGERFFYIFMK